MERKSFVLCLVCSALFLAFFVARPASSQPVKPQAPEKTSPVSSEDRELRDRMAWARGLALLDEFLVQYLMEEAGVDPDRADKVRRILLETRIYHRETILKIRSEMVGEEKRQDRIPRIARAAAARSAEDKQKLATVLTAKELEEMKKSQSEAHFQAGIFMRRHDERPGR